MILDSALDGNPNRRPAEPWFDFVLSPLSKNDPRNHTKWTRNKVSYGFVDRLNSHEGFKMGHHPMAGSFPDSISLRPLSVLCVSAVSVFSGLIHG
jgi:hypothetical protein